MRKSDRKLLQAAYNLITDITFTSYFRALKEEIRARLSEPEPEPVGYMWDIDRYNDHRPAKDCLAKTINPDIPKDKIKNLRPVYTHPPRPTGLDQLLERIRFLERQIAERKNQ